MHRVFHTTDVQRFYLRLTVVVYCDIQGLARGPLSQWLWDVLSTLNIL
jgi:hypothetical protein